MAILTTAADVHLRSSQAMNLSSLSPFSVTTWIKATWTPGGRRSFVGIYGPSTDVPLATPVTALQIGTSTGAGELTCWTWGGGTMVGTATGSMTTYNNLWVFIVYTFNGTTHRVYRNGALLASSTTAQIAGFLNQVYINGYPGGGTGEVDAFEVDQYALFNRELSIEEIQTMYYANGARHGIHNGIVARYDFDERSQGSSASGVVDLSGNEHTLTLTGASTAITHTYVNTLANSNIRPVQ